MLNFAICIKYCSFDSFSVSAHFSNVSFSSQNIWNPIKSIRNTYVRVYIHFSYSLFSFSTVFVHHLNKGNGENDNIIIDNLFRSTVIPIQFISMQGNTTYNKFMKI